MEGDRVWKHNAFLKVPTAKNKFLVYTDHADDINEWMAV